MTVYDVDIVERIVQAEVIAPAELAEHMGISQRTLRDHVRRINDELKDVACIHYARSRGGYVFEILDKPMYGAWRERRHALLREDPASSADARVAYLLNDLLLRNDWITLDVLASILFVSRACISNDLKRVELELARHGLTLKKRPRYGIRVEGSEMNRRLCLAEATVRRMARRVEGTSSGSGVKGGSSPAAFDAASEDAAAASILKSIPASVSDAEPSVADEDRFSRLFAPILNAVSACVDEVLAAEEFAINSLSYQNLLVHIAIAVLRIKGGNPMPTGSTPVAKLSGTRECAVAKRIAATVGEHLAVELPASEVGYIAIHLAGKRVVFDSQEESQVITDEIWNIVGRMLEIVWSTYRFDFRGDMELRMNLARHIAPLAVRLTYHMHLENPLLNDIKSRFPLAYAMAGEASTVLADAYGYYPSDHELGYLAMAFALALERQKTGRDKKRLLVVCASGVASARLLAYKIEQEFDEHIARIDTCNVAQVSSQDFDQIDYVFTTVPLRVPVPVPVREITLLLNDDDRALMRDMFEDGASNYPATYLPRSLFFAHENFSSKQEAIAALSERMRAAYPDQIPADFEQLVWQREEAAPTSFGNSVALPHPVKAVSASTLVAVALLDKPIDWGMGMVQAIFLLSFSCLPDAKLDGVYRPLASLLNDGRAIKELVRAQSYEQLIDELRRR